MLHQILRSHPQMSGFHDTDAFEDEGQHLQGEYRTAWAHGGPGRFGFDPSAHLTEASELVERRVARRLVRAWSGHWDLSRPVLLEKSPPNLIRMRFLQALFHGAAFVMILRHPVVVTLATKRWMGKYSLDSLVEHWFLCHFVFLADALSIERVHVVKYEDLCARPEATLAQVGAFLGVDPTFDVSALDAAGSASYIEAWEATRRSMTHRVQIWRWERRFGRQAEAFGYRLDDLRWSAPLVADCANPG